tara:strand:- start:590 stop:850 length:261 start_codon:yes stop_codon:yes gene_type:complete
MSVNVESKNKEFKTFRIDLKELNLDERSALNDKFMQEANEGLPKFSFWVDVVRQGTELPDEEINKFSTDELIAIANKIFEEANKKK